MATNYWKGTTGEWTLDANWSEGAYPVDGDVVIFDGRVSQSVTSGMTDGGPDDDPHGSGYTAKGDWDMLHVKEGFAGSIGTAAEPLCCHCRKIIIEGTGTYHILCGEKDQSTDATIDLVIVNNSSATVYLYSNANDGENTCQFTNVYVVAGTVYLAEYTVDTDDQGVYVANLYVLPRGNSASAATVDIAEGCYKINGAVPMNLYMRNGTVTTDSHLGTVFMSSGTLNFGSDGAELSIDQDITTLIAFGGFIYWYPDDDSDDSYIGRAVLVGATLDASGTTNPDRAKVLGNGADNDIVIGEGGELNIANNRSNITLAGSSELINFGGVVATDISHRQVTTGIELGIDLAHA